MRKIFYSLCLTICLLLGLNGLVLAAEQTAPVDAKAYYLEVLKEYQNNPIKADIQALITMPLGNVSFVADVEGLAPEAKVFKAVSKLTIAAPGKEPATKEYTYYYEQTKNRYIVYTQNNDKWFKSVTPLKNGANLYESSKISLEKTMEFVKTVEFLTDTPDIKKLKVTFDFKKLSDTIEESLLESKGVFKDDKEKDEVIAFYRQFVQNTDYLVVYYTIDNKSRSCAVEADFSNIIKSAVDIFLNNPNNKLKPEDKQLIEKLLADSSISMKTNMQIIDKAELITVPQEVKRNAKEIKQPKKAKETSKTTDATKQNTIE